MVQKNDRKRGKKSNTTNIIHKNQSRRSQNTRERNKNYFSRKDVYCMTSFLRTKIVERYTLYNNQKIQTQDIKKMAKEQSMEEKDLLVLLDVSGVAANKCLHDIECKFYIKIYSQEEMEEIEQKVREELGRFAKVNGNILALVKQRYRLSSKDMRRILNANYVTYKNAEQKNNYINIKKQTTSCPYEAEIVKKWKKKDNITYKSIFSMKQKYHLTLEEIRSILNISKTDFNALITRKKKKVKIQVPNSKLFKIVFTYSLCCRKSKVYLSDK